MILGCMDAKKFVFGLKLVHKTDGFFFPHTRLGFHSSIVILEIILLLLMCFLSVAFIIMIKLGVNLFFISLVSMIPCFVC